MMRDEIISFKKYLTGIISMDNETFEMAMDYLEIEKIRKGEYFIREGQICIKIGYINKGLFRIYYLKDGNEINTCFCKED